MAPPPPPRHSTNTLRCHLSGRTHVASPQGLDSRPDRATLPRPLPPLHLVPPEIPSTGLAQMALRPSVTEKLLPLREFLERRVSPTPMPSLPPATQPQRARCTCSLLPLPPPHQRLVFILATACIGLPDRAARRSTEIWASLDASLYHAPSISTYCSPWMGQGLREGSLVTTRNMQWMPSHSLLLMTSPRPPLNPTHFTRATGSTRPALCKCVAALADVPRPPSSGLKSTLRPISALK